MTRIHLHNLYKRENAYLCYDASREIVITATSMFIKVIKFAGQSMN